MITVAGMEFLRVYAGFPGVRYPTNTWRAFRDSKDVMFHVGYKCDFRRNKAGKWTFDGSGFPERGWHETPKLAYVAHLDHQVFMLKGELLQKLEEIRKEREKAVKP